MALNRAALHYDNLILRATLSATSAASATMGVEKLKTSSPRERYRTTGANGETIIATTGRSEFWPLVYLGGFIVSPSATVQIRISDNADLSSPTYDCTFNALPSITGLGEGGLGMGGLGGYPIYEEMQDWQFNSAFLLDLVLTGSPAAVGASTLTLPETLERSTGTTEKVSREDGGYLAATVYITAGTGAGQSRVVSGYDGMSRRLTLESPWSVQPNTGSTLQLDLSYPIERAANDGNYSGKYLGITITDPDSANGYIDLGVLMAGDYVQPEYDLDPDYGNGWEDPSQQLESYGREIFTDELNMYRQADFAWSWLTEAEANELVNRMGPKIGRRRPFLMLPYFENSSRLYDDAIYGLSTTGIRKGINPAVRGARRWRAGFNMRGL